jgi:hypothetical protein
MRVSIPTVADLSPSTFPAGSSEPAQPYFPREVFFFCFGFPGLSLPAAAARFFCFFVATDPPHLGAISGEADVTRLAA